MARLVRMERGCENGCGRVQTHVLLDVHGHPKGAFCHQCGDVKLVELRLDEERRLGPVPEPPDGSEP